MEHFFQIVCKGFLIKALMDMAIFQRVYKGFLIKSLMYIAVNSVKEAALCCKT